jgi:hypothetical protein
MLTPEQAREQLKEFQLPDNNARLARVAALPTSLRQIGEAALDFTTGHGWNAEAHQRAQARGEQLSRLDRLSLAERQKLFGALFPRMAAQVEAAWQLRGRLPYQVGWQRRAFRAPDSPEVNHVARLSWLDQLLRVTETYEQDVLWFATWTPYLNYAATDALGVLLAAAIDLGDAEGQAVFDTLTASARGEHPIGAMGRHVSRALLNASRPEGWDFIERMLLAAQRQEGLRQVILETIDEAHPLAFRRMLRLILDHKLIRFSATVRAADVWFGLMWDAASPRVITTTLERALHYLEDSDARRQAINDPSAEETFLALWAEAFENAPATIEPATRLLTDASVERRFIGAHFLALLGLPAARQMLASALDDDDLRVAVRALQEFRLSFVQDQADLFERLERNLPRFPRQKQTLKPVVWPWMSLDADQADLADALIHHLGSRPPKRLIHHIPAMSPGSRAHVARKLAELETWDAEVREVFFKLVGDASYSVREAALKAVKSQTLTEVEVMHLEKLLTREAGDLRRGVINLLLKLEDRDALASAERLLVAALPQRLAGLELLQELQKAKRAASECQKLADHYRDTRNALSPAETKLLDQLNGETYQGETPTLENGLGLFDPAQRTKPTPPRKQKTSKPLVTPAVNALCQSLDQLIHAQRETPITIKTYVGQKEELLGNAQWGFSRPDPNTPIEKDRENFPLREVWETWWQNRPAAQRDKDGLEILRALAPGQLHIHSIHLAVGREVPAWLQAVQTELYGKPQTVNYPTQVGLILQWLLRLQPPSGAADFLLEAIERTLALIPQEELVRKPPPKQPYVNYYSDWRHNQFLLGWLGLARQHRALCPQDWTAEQHVRFWKLVRWMDEPGTDLPRHRPPLEEILIAHQAGGATEADLLDHLLGPRPQAGYDGLVFYYGGVFHELSLLTSRKPPANLAKYSVLPELVQRCRERIIAVELQRGDLPTAASAAAMSLRSTGGLKTLIQLLQAFSREKFIRGWVHDSQSKAAVFSHLLRVTLPEEGDTPAAFAAQIKAAPIPDQRLIELALYAPQWAQHVEAAVGWAGLAEGIWWIHAHTKDRQWRVDNEIRETWTAQISERTPLTGENLLDGAVDVAWFQRVRKNLNSERWEVLYEAAAYASGGQGHGRARLFADAMLGEVSQAELTKRITSKRQQDSVRALGLLPLAKGKQREADVLERYEVIQEFKRGSRKFGSMKQASEKLAARIGLENLARTAGYPDPVRLEWAMEARAIADLAERPQTVKAGEVKISLAINDLGEPTLTITKANKPLKAIPAAIKKNPEVVELLERKREVEKQKSRMRQSLEEAMCRGDLFTSAELQTLLEHPLLAPMLQQLVFVGEGLAGYPVKHGKALEAHDGAQSSIKSDTQLRIAHSHDLLTTGEWDQWQRECFRRERIQPFKQIFRELYMLTAAEQAEGTLSRRYAGHQVNPKQALALLTTRGWVTVPEEGVRRTFHDESLSVWLTWLNAAFTPAEVEGLTMEGVMFTRPGEWKPLDLSEVPPRVFSEVMRDVDLVVSVAHMGGVDPEASASTVEMRATLIRETCGLLKIDNVRLNGTHALVDGHLSHYSIHLGSAVVHRQPGGALCIVPVHAQQRGRLFLPFADDDPKTAEVISKILLLARDKEIKDPTILEQILH